MMEKNIHISLLNFFPYLPFIKRRGVMNQILGILICSAITPSQQAGCYNCIAMDGTVYSSQPNGSIESRPSGTDGPFEQGQLEGTLIVFCSNGVYNAYGVLMADKLAK